MAEAGKKWVKDNDKNWVDICEIVSKGTCGMVLIL